MSDRFVGRGAEMEALRVMLAKGRRLISVVGAAGTGKTRLVRELGVGLGARGLVRLCDLAEVRDTEALSDAVLRAMGVPPVGQNLARQVEQALAVQRELMLILDNAERIGDGLQEPLKRWLEEAPELRVVVTSRQPVGMEQEQLLELEPLGLPAPDAGLVEVEQSEAVQLFVERLRQLQGRFILNDSNRAVVCTLVRMLDGLPLALELAAARVPMLSLEGLKAQLHRRFEVLRGSPRFTPLRHISLRVALDGSWEQLDPSEQMALAQASVFEGGFSLEDVEAVLEVATPPTQAQLLDVLDVLLLRSLVKVDIDAREGPRRFRMLVSVQAYARERLTEMDETVATERRHLEWFAQQGSQEALEAVHGHEGHTLFLMLAQNLDNLRAALARSVAMGAWPEAAQVSMALGTLYERQGPYHIGARNLAQVATHAEVPEQARAQLHYVRAKLLRLGGKIKEARATREKALELARRIGARRLEAACLGYSVDKGDGDPNARCEQALELARELGERRIEGDCLGEYGVLLQRQGRLDEALDRLRQAVNIAVEVGDAYAEAQWTVAIGKVFHSKGELVGSRHHIEQALRLHRKVGNRRGEVNARVYLAVLDKREGRMEEAQRRYEETLVMMRELENVEGECMIYGNLGNIYKSQGWLD
ncbi:MAG: tetratricopeptide repeat protein, partial [Myxococcota bacterium]